MQFAMTAAIQEIPPDRIADYAAVPIAYVVSSVYRVVLLKNGLGGIQLVEEQLPEPYVKDYDASEEGGPESWLRQFDVCHWGFFLAQQDGLGVGGAVMVFDTPGVHLLEGRRDLSVLWDIRVHPDFRRQGVGGALFRYIVDWARQRNCRQIKIETQNVNVPACRFYCRQGCRLGAIHRHAYAAHPALAHEVRLDWYYDL